MPLPLSSDLDSIWTEVREALAESLPPSTFELWLEALRPVSLRAGTLELEAPSSSREWVERRYGALIERVARDRSADVERVELLGAKRAEEPHPDVEPLKPNPLHTFDRFVIGPGNRLAHSAALAVAESPGEAYNPLFLHGPPGLGKTHLLGAVANYLGDRRPDLSVHCTTAERFTTEFVTCLREDGPAAFKRRHRDVDALLIDDVQALEGKPKTEEEFVDTFNALHLAGKQIALSSDRPPEALEHLAERLRDRFHWGLTVELAPPDVRTRVALLWRMTTSLPLPLDDPGALASIAASVPDNVRRLEGAMTRVAALGSMLSEPLTHGLVDRALGASAKRDHKPADATPRTDAIKEAVAEATGLDPQQLSSSSRAPRIAQARQVAVYLSRELTNASLAGLARDFNRDHATIRHAIRAVEGRLEADSPTARTLEQAREILGVSRTPKPPAAPRAADNPHPRPTSANPHERS